jgi:hypothetical protein
MGKSLQDLGLREDTLPTAGQDLGDLPEFGSFQRPPQPGPFRFKLPADLSSIYDTIDVPDKTPPQRISVVFDRDHPLLILQSLGNRYNGDPLEIRISNNERPRGKDKAVTASDLDYLLKALGETVKPKSNRDYIVTMQKQGGKEFGADLTYSWQCRTGKNVRVFRRDPQTGAVAGTEEKPDQQGCGLRFYQKDVAKEPGGDVPYEIQCHCGAALRAFAGLENFRA